MTQSGLIVTTKEGNVAVVELNRPKKRNALSQDLIDELIEALSQLDKDTAVRAVVLTGSKQGPFCGMSSGVPLKHACANVCLQLAQILVNWPVLRQLRLSSEGG